MGTNSTNVQAWRKRAKAKLVEIAGGKCGLCGYDKCVTALEFHHIDPATKDFAVTGSRVIRRFELLVAEVRKCVLVCANCHREIHSGLHSQDVITTAATFDEGLAQQHLMAVVEARAVGWFKKVEADERRQARERERLEKKRIQAERAVELARWKEDNPHCDHRIKKVNWSQYDVFQLLEEHKSYEAVGRLLGVTGAAIKRRVKHLQSKL